MQKLVYDIVIIGGGPAGLAAANTAVKQGAKALIIEREAALGGILKQCIHDGFGVVRYKEKLTGSEYAQREIDEAERLQVPTLLLTYVTRIERGKPFTIHFVNRKGTGIVVTDKIILATGCRERTSKQIGVHGTNPAGVMTAGTAQHYINLMGKMPTKKCVILGSGDIGLIMARRLTLEGAKVVGVYEAKSTPSGLTRNLVQCLDDFDIPLHLSHTVTRVFGVDRLTAVEMAQVDEKMNPIAGTEEIIECDALILSVGLIPENEIAHDLGVQLCKYTKGAVVDQNFMTLLDNVYSCGNAMHVNDLVDYVSESGEIAGTSATKNVGVRHLINVQKNSKLSYVVPQRLNVNGDLSKVTFYFRSAAECKNMCLSVKADDKVIFTKNYSSLRPPEMERLTIDMTQSNDAHFVDFELEEK